VKHTTAAFRPFTIQRPSRSSDAKEVWADMFLFWVFGGQGFKSDPAGSARRQWIEENMPIYTSAAYRRNLDVASLIGGNVQTGTVKTDVEQEGGWLNIRREPGTEATAFSSIPYAGSVTILGIDKDNPNWVAVQYGTEIGWISSDEAQIPTDTLSSISRDCVDWLSGNLVGQASPCS